MNLTPRQTEVLEHVRDYMVVRGYSPSIREIAAHFGISVNGAAGHLDALERKGEIVREPGVARTIRMRKVKL